VPLLHNTRLFPSFLQLLHTKNTGLLHHRENPSYVPLNVQGKQPSMLRFSFKPREACGLPEFCFFFRLRRLKLYTLAFALTCACVHSTRSRALNLSSNTFKASLFFQKFSLLLSLLVKALVSVFSDPITVDFSRSKGCIPHARKTPHPVLYLRGGTCALRKHVPPQNAHFINSLGL
jgi:hypothetical protein